MIDFNLLLQLFSIAFILCFIIDYSGFIDELENIITVLTKSTFKVHIPKPFSCSLCMTFWVCSLYLILIGVFSLTNMAIVCILAASTAIITPIMVLIRDLIVSIIIKLNSRL